jgi:succinate dehydrogenase / fumarate reductase iron-sulfur subunit
MEKQKPKIRITVYRQKPGGEASSVNYTVPYRKGMSVLDALEDIRRINDASLAFPHACRHGKSCRMCLAEINGKVGYLCATPVRDGMKIKPIPNRPVVRDLITES